MLKVFQMLNSSFVQPALRRPVAVLALTLSLSAPVAAQDLGAALSRAPEFSSFTAAIDRHDIAPTGPATIFAPTDEAFANLPEALRDRVSDSPEVMQSLLRAHIVPGASHEADALPVEMQTASGGRLLVTYSRGALTLRLAEPENTTDPEMVARARAMNSARVIAGGLNVDGMMVHAIDTVLIPLDLDTQLAAAEAGQESDAPASNDERTDFAEEIVQSDDGPTPDIAPVSEGDAGTDLTEQVDPGISPVPQEGTVVEIPPIVLLPDDATSDGAEGQEGQDRAGAQDGQSQSNTDSDSDSTQTASPTGDPAVDLASETISVSALLDRTVRNPAGDEVGTVTDVELSLASAQVTSLVVITDRGFLGLGENETQRVDVADVSIDPLDGAVIVPEGAFSSGSGD